MDGHVPNYATAASGELAYGRARESTTMRNDTIFAVLVVIGLLLLAAGLFVWWRNTL